MAKARKDERGRALRKGEVAVLRRMRFRFSTDPFAR